MNADLTSENAYVVLGVSREADLPSIRRAFRALALRHHPDAQPPDEKAAAALRFARVNRAHEILRDPEKRKRYDALLERGHTPVLDTDAGAEEKAQSLADIIGDVQSLGLGSERDETMARIPEDLRDRLLRPMLIEGPGFREGAIEALPFFFTPDGNGAIAKLEPLERMFLGTLQAGALVLTELRLILLATYSSSIAAGNTVTTRTTFRSFALPYAAIERIRLIQDGRAAPQYRLELFDREGVRFELSLLGDRMGESIFHGAFRPSRLARLLLVAGRHGLTLEGAHEGSQASEHRRALPKTLAPVAAWLVPFVLVTPFLVLDGNLIPWIEVAGFLNRYGLTAIAAGLLPILTVLNHGRIVRAWKDHTGGGEP